MRKIAIIPTLLTLGNAVCGFAALAYAGKIDQEGATVASNNYFLALSGWLIVGAMIFDSLDGFIARLARSTSKFGGELDSLCDAISFGAAPAFILLRMGPGWDRPMWHRALAVIATLYVVCAVLRLARYNVESLADAVTSKRFRGLPSPAAAGCLASLAILRGNLDGWVPVDSTLAAGLVDVWAMLGGVLVALLMVSRVPYPHLTKQLLRGRKHFNHLMQLVLAAFLIVLLRELAVVVVFWGYALFVLAQTALARVRQPEPIPATGLEEISH